jgi:hypothetical protein
MSVSRGTGVKGCTGALAPPFSKWQWRAQGRCDGRGDRVGLVNRGNLIVSAVDFVDFVVAIVVDFVVAIVVVVVTVVVAVAVLAGSVQFAISGYASHRTLDVIGVWRRTRT